MLQKLNAFFEQPSRGVSLCLSAFLKCQMCGKSVVEGGQLCRNVQRAVHFNLKNRGMDRMPSIALKKSFRKKYYKHLLSYFQKTKLTKTKASIFAESVNQIKKTKLQLEPNKFADFFVDGQSIYTSSFVSLRKIFVN